MEHIKEAEGAPKAVGPYSLAVIVPPGKSLIFCSGQIPLDPATGEIVKSRDDDKGEEISVQTEQALKNLRAVLEAAGASLQDVGTKSTGSFLSLIVRLGQLSK